MATGLPGGIGIPHARSEHVTQASLVFGRAPEGIDWGAADGPANLVFLIAGPKGRDEDHLSVLATLARRLTRADFRRSLLEAPTRRPWWRSCSGRSSGHERRDGVRVVGDEGRQVMKVVPVVKWSGHEAGRGHVVPDGDRPHLHGRRVPRAERPRGRARDRGGDAGRRGVRPARPADTIAAADAVIMAADVEVRGRERFAGKPTVSVGVKPRHHRRAGPAGAGRRRRHRGGHAASGRAGCGPPGAVEPSAPRHLGRRGPRRRAAAGGRLRPRSRWRPTSGGG